MKLKELMRDLIAEEIHDISVYSAEAEFFGANSGNGEWIRELFTRLAEEKRGRLKNFDRISRERTGFRQRRMEEPRSIEASLRAHITRTEKSAALYSSLRKLIDKPEYKEAFGAILAREREALASLRALQSRLRQPENNGRKALK